MMIVVPPVVLDLLVEFSQACTKFGGFDTCPVEHTSRDASHPRHVQTEGLGALSWLEFVQEYYFICGFISSAGHVVEFHTVVGTELVQEHVIVSGKQGSALQRIHKILQYSMCNGVAVESASAPAQLIDNGK